MQLSDFYYELPDKLIARYPNPERSASRLLVLDKQSGAIAHHTFKQLPDFFQPGDLLVFNNTQVIPARLFGNKQTGGKVELLIERILNETQAWAHIRASKAPPVNSLLVFAEGFSAEVLEKKDALYHLSFNQPVLEILNKIGHMPLPPYLKREDELSDQSSYQTVYAKIPGAVAAPTAGLHFDEPLLKSLKEKGVELAYVTLHVGAGTFQPVRVNNIKEHVMHSEYLEVSSEVCEKIKKTKAAGGRVIAVGTTSVRALESASASGEIQPYSGDTQIFIYPGYTFKTIDAMITNFHLPESTLLMLISAFAGIDSIRNAYQVAIEEKYRFYSYGDGMLIGSAML